MVKLKKMVVLAIAFISFALYSEKIKFSDSWGPQGFSLTDTKNNGVSVTYSINDFSTEKNIINDQMKTTIQLPGVFLPNDAGAPDLPGSARNIAIPQGSKVSYKIADMRKEVYQNIEMAPAPILPADTDRQPMVYKENKEIFGKEAFYPESPVILSKPSKIRGLDIVTLGVTPFQYNPVTKELIVYRDLKIEVTFEGGNNHFGDDRLRNRHWDRILKNAVMNPDVLQDIKYRTKSESKSTDYEYIIICGGDAFIPYANQLRDFRIKQGIRTGVVTLSQIGGNTSAAIETYINNAYNTWDIPPSSVLLMGDWGAQNTINTIYSPKFVFEGASYCVSDNFYADVDTQDGKGLPEIVFARMTAQNETQLQTMVSKIINYETNPPTGSNFYNSPVTALGWQTERWFQICSETIGGYMKNVLGKTPVRINAVYGGDPDTDPWSTAPNTSQVVDYFGPSGRGYIPSSPSTLGNWTAGNAAAIVSALNSGAFMIQHRDHGTVTGWGEPYFQSSDINSLTNTNLSFVFSMNCLTGKYNDSYECFTEKFHRYTYNGNNAGALGLIAATEESFSFVNDTFAWGIYDYLWPSFMNDYGSPTTNNDEFMPAFAEVSGKIFLDYSSWPYNIDKKEVTNYLFHMHGDPYLNVYTEVPQNLTVNHGDLYDGQSTINVSADLGSEITLVANGEIIGKGIGTGSLSVITIPPQFSSVSVTLTVTKHNYFRYESTFIVKQPYTNTGGIYSQSVSSLSFGTITLGNSTNRQFSITNSHSSEFIVGQINSISGYTVLPCSKGIEEFPVNDTKNIINYTVPPNSTRNYDIEFDPSDAGIYNGNITVTSSDLNHSTEYIAVTGTCLKPEINIDPVSLFALTVPGSTVSKQFNIENTDLGQLDYSISANYNYGKSLKGAGGPDIYGYEWKDSDEPDGPVYNWVEISSIGTIIPIADEAESDSIPMGMTFNFYGNDYTSIHIADNGTLLFNEENVPYLNGTIPDISGPNAMIAPFWDDINCGSVNSGDVYYYFDAVNSRFIVEYNSIVDYSLTTTETFEVILYENGNIVFQYKEMNGSLNDCTVGIENGTGTGGLLVAYNTAYLKNNMAIEIQPTPEWLSLDCISGTISGVGSRTITATCNAGLLEFGTYKADITISSNDPDEAGIILPLTFTVTNPTGPNINLSTALIHNTAAPEGSVLASFNIGNIGLEDLNYSITSTYTDPIVLDTTVFIMNSNDFNSSLGWTGSGTQCKWLQTTTYNDGNVSGTPFAYAANSKPLVQTGLLISPVINLSGCSSGSVTISFEQYKSVSGGICTLEASTDGITYTNLYFITNPIGGWGNPGSPNKRKITVPDTYLVATARFRFLAQLTSEQGYWAIDNVKIEHTEITGTPWTWMTLDSPLTGTVTAPASNTFNITCSASGLAVGTYNANITIVSNDPDEPNKVLPVEFVVANTVVPGVPSNVTASVSGTNIVIDWNVSANATSYDVYSSDNPYGTFTFVTNVATNQYITTYTATRKFYYIVAKNSTKLNESYMSKIIKNDNKK
ncbi:MAG: C25 family cysteine peptidase [Candidatus Delongbacteria bacterium]|jgi:hypothetical protein|nr:C25 family cysteine peptidase [Candidatus Delongbacteria bacterium]